MSKAKAVVEREIRICIKNACPACYSGDKAEKDKDGRWWHVGYDEIEDDDNYLRDVDRECDAADLHEAMRNIRTALRGKPKRRARKLDK